jgi:hypothetical protein
MQLARRADARDHHVPPARRAARATPPLRAARAILPLRAARATLPLRAARATLPLRAARAKPCPCAPPARDTAKPARTGRAKT